MEVWDRNYMLVSVLARSTMPLQSADLSPLYSLQETLQGTFCYWSEFTAQHNLNCFGPFVEGEYG